MNQVAVVYFSVDGSVSRLCEVAAEGVSEVTGCTPLLHEIHAEELSAGRYTNLELIRKLCGCRAQIWGTPTYMGGPAAQFKAFADASSEVWEARGWVDQIAAGITAGACVNGDQGATLQAMQVLAAQHGMLWAGPDSAGGTAGNPLGCSLGVTAHVERGPVTAAMMFTAKALGRRVAQFASRVAPSGTRPSGKIQQG